MSRTLVAILLCTLTMALTGCASTGEVENQAYALVLGIDERDGGGVELTIRIPRIGHTGTNGEGGAPEQPYLVISAGGDSYAQALEHLQWAVARELNLSHIKLIMVSEALASGPAFPALIAEVAETRHLYTTAGFIVCECRAKTFIEGQETILGTRLSSEIGAMFRHYAAHGYIPRATFADLYYATRSDYGDPVGIWGFMDDGETAQEPGVPAAAVIGNQEERLNAETKTASSRQYLGTALFREGRMVGKLDAEETLFLNLLTGGVESFGYSCKGRCYMMSTLRGPARSVTFDVDRLKLRATVYLNTEDESNRQDMNQLQSALSRDLEALIQRCQRLQIDPFGFAEAAARHFQTLDQWRDFHWRQAFAGADAEVEVRVS